MLPAHRVHEAPVQQSRVIIEKLIPPTRENHAAPLEMANALVDGTKEMINGTDSAPQNTE